MRSSPASADVRSGFTCAREAVVCAGSWFPSHTKVPRDPGSRLKVRFQTPLAQIIRFAGWRPVARRAHPPRRRTKPRALAPCSGAIWHLGPVAAAASGFGECLWPDAWGGEWASPVMSWVVLMVCCATMALGRLGPVTACFRGQALRLGALLGGLLTLLLVISCLLGFAGGVGTWEGREAPRVVHPPHPIPPSVLRRPGRSPGSPGSGARSVRPHVRLPRRRAFWIYGCCHQRHFPAREAPCGN